MRIETCLAILLGLAGGATAQTALRVLQDEYPRAYFFRASESTAANARISYQDWEKNFARLMGIEGKVLDEEVPGRSARNIEFFTRFKQRHPDQLVLLHFNGNARDPRYQAGEFFAGHWLYYNGAKILADVPAEEGETDLHVSDPTLFRAGIGRYRNSNEDIALCALDASGRPDWFASEQVQLVSVDRKRGLIRVRRGCYGTRPRAFAAGQAYAAAHKSEGPWGKGSNLLWDYNHSTRCPRDARGRTANDVLVDDLAPRLLPGGELAAFDGLEFDVLHHQTARPAGGRGVDSDGDGVADGGISGGVNAYGVGTIEFCRKLRQRLGDTRLILADGMGLGNQRAFQILNGIESEGFPQLRDLEMRDWPGGLNRHFFWLANARPPVFNYINHKFNEPDASTGLPVTPELPFSTHRLVFAATVFTDSALCYSLAPPAEDGELIGIWDELRSPWLGKPLGAAVRLAKLAPRIDGVEVQDSATGEVRLRARIPARGPDLFVTLSARGEPMKGYPREAARMMWVAAGQQRYMSWVNDREFESAFYFPQVQGDVELEVSVEGPEPAWISQVAAYAHPDAIYRDFEHGVVLANPSPRPYTFDLGELFPGRAFHRLQGTPRQDPKTNDGSPVSGRLTLAPHDALFLRGDHR